MTDHEGYWENSTIHCNECAEHLFGLTGHKEQHEGHSKKRCREPEPEEQAEEEISCDQMRDLTDESCDIWELALDINHGNSESALRMIEDQPRLRAHPRVIEYYRAKEEDMDFEECSSECSSEDEDLQERKRARHTHAEDSNAEDSNAEDEADDEDAMVIDLLSQDEEDDENYAGIYKIKRRRHWNFSIGYDGEDDDEEDENYDYAESVVDDDGEVSEDDNEDADAMDMSNSVTMPQTSMVQMVTMIQELQAENASLREELELIRNQRRMLFPEGSSMSITDEDGQRYINVHAQSPSRGLTMADLDCGNDNESASDEEDDFEMEEDE